MKNHRLPTAPRTVGDYELLEKIAEGGTCTVFRARNRVNGQIVAVKILPRELARNPVLLRRFEQEFRAAVVLHHANIVRALDFSEDDEAPFLVMEFIDGMSLGEKVQREGRLPEAEAVHLILQVCRGLHYAHGRGVIHRDVKPDNILVTAHGEAKLTDLGLIKEVRSGQDLTRTGGGLGTPHYMAPEQFHDAKNADARCDVYGLGATLYSMVTGELPFGHANPVAVCQKKMRGELTPPRTLVPHLSARTEQAICRAMAVDRDQRLASCLEFERALTTAPLSPARNPAAATATPFAASSSRPVPSSAGLTYWIVGTLALIALAAGYFLLR